MNTKSVLIGAALIIVGAILGFGISNCSLGKGKKGCATEQVGPKPECNRGEYGPHHNGPRGPREMLDKLNLTEEQKTKVDAIFDAKHEAMKAEREKTHEQIKALLNDEQKKQFDEIEANCKPRDCKDKKPCCNKK